MNAVRRGDVSAICSLRLKGADAHKKDDSGINALQLAEDMGDAKVLGSLTKSLVAE